MRDLIAGVVAIFLLFVAFVLVRALRDYRRRREADREAARLLGRRVVAELPAGADLTLFAEDPARFYYGERAIAKDLVAAVRVLVNGSPIAAYESARFPASARGVPASFHDRPDGIARDRWDVAIELASGTVLVECGAIRERVSQELARQIFDAVRRTLEEMDHDHTN